MKMKHLPFLLLFFIFAGYNTIAQELIKQSEVPSNIIRRFEQKNRSASDIKWYRNEHKTYTAIFIDRGNKTEITLDSGGKAIKKVQTISLGNFKINQ